MMKLVVLMFHKNAVKQTFDKKEFTLVITSNAYSSVLNNRPVTLGPDSLLSFCLLSMLSTNGYTALAGIDMAFDHSEVASPKVSF